MNKSMYTKIMIVRSDGQVKRTRIGAKHLVSTIKRSLKPQLA